MKHDTACSETFSLTDGVARTPDSESLYELVNRLLTEQHVGLHRHATLRNAVMDAIERAVTDGMTPEGVNDVIRPLVGTGTVTP